MIAQLETNHEILIFIKLKVKDLTTSRRVHGRVEVSNGFVVALWVTDTVDEVPHKRSSIAGNPNTC
jgi:hypothetical protein